MEAGFDGGLELAGACRNERYTAVLLLCAYAKAVVYIRIAVACERGGCLDIRSAARHSVRKVHNPSITNVRHTSKHMALIPAIFSFGVRFVCQWRRFPTRFDISRIFASHGTKQIIEPVRLIPGGLTK